MSSDEIINRLAGIVGNDNLDKKEVEALKTAINIIKDPDCNFEYMRSIYEHIHQQTVIRWIMVIIMFIGFIVPIGMLIRYFIYLF